MDASFSEINGIVIDDMELFFNFMKRIYLLGRQSSIDEFYEVIKATKKSKDVLFSSKFAEALYQEGEKNKNEKPLNISFAIKKVASEMVAEQTAKTSICEK